jgi:hypothetical protein
LLGEQAPHRRLVEPRRQDLGDVFYPRLLPPGRRERPVRLEAVHQDGRQLAGILDCRGPEHERIEPPGHGLPP